MFMPDAMKHDLMKVMEEERARSVRYAWQRPAVRRHRIGHLIDWLGRHRELVVKRVRRRGTTVARSERAAM